MAEISPITVARFWSKVSVTGKDSDCWEWNASREEKGYGRFRLPGPDRRTWAAHRVAYAIYHGGFPPEGQLVRHSCDNPSCVNPYHLEAGTATDNMQDMVQKGRYSRRPRSRVGPKLIDSDITLIRRKIEAGETNTKIAAFFGISDSIVGRIRRRKVWPAALSTRTPPND